MKTVKVAILGLGTVGSGVYKLIQKRADVMEKTIGAQMEVKKILVRNMNKKREGVDQSLLTDKWEDIMNDDEIEIVIEVMGGIEPARTMILEALHAGKNVVTANKDLVATHGHELLEAAEESGVDFLFEAAVAGAIPIIRPLKQCLAANEIQEVIGIVNGTTNFILTKMIEEGMDFDDALALATELGYAEADPTADIEGLDAGRKVAIMASIAFHSRVTFDDVYTEGIAKITSKDIRYAKEMVEEASLLQKEEFPMSELIIGTECGGSDPTSGLAANVLIGELSDRIVAEGGTSILSETTEFIGAEHILASRAATPEVRDRIFEIVHRYEKALQLVGEEVREGNPSPGNKAGGITTLEEKSLGCIHKGGHTPVMDVYD